MKRIERMIADWISANPSNLRYPRSISTGCVLQTNRWLDHLSASAAVRVCHASAAGKLRSASGQSDRKVGVAEKATSR